MAVQRRRAAVDEGQQGVPQQPFDDKGQLYALERPLLAHRWPVETDPKGPVAIFWSKVVEKSEFGDSSRSRLAAQSRIKSASSSRERSYWTGATQCDDADQWLASATEMPGIWWTGWIQWLAPKTGKPVAARRRLDSSQDPVIARAPGRYVKARAS
jgi:hypothetical protein